MRFDKVRIDGESLTVVLDGVVVISLEMEKPAARSGDNRRQGVKVLSMLNFDHRFARSGHGRQIHSVALVRYGGVRIQINGAPELRLRAFPIPVKLEFDEGQRCVRLRESSVQAKSFLCRLFRSEHSLTRHDPG